MTKTYKTVEDCTRLWVSEFNAIPTMMISELMNVDPDSWSEVTEPSSGVVVFVAGNVGTVETVRDGEVLGPPGQRAFLLGAQGKVRGRLL